ncbi:Phage tail assembly chaperone protein [uncultured Caudovirales phage]|uniref:Phage tail assembly chaperone protein n=1 Tax=uncultured Caudovirales phage TaxID=2100421 RepID=A0A6J5MAT2_9CAUD|nr:Phage tail assembly chaperone protein [uncultured Caudovirales phage]
MSFTFNEVYPDATNEQKWEQIKLWRNAQLAASDWTQLPDAPVDKAAWATYRQALRDLPVQGGIADAAEFPVAP